MATNPYITVPGGPEWMQKLWLAQYMQNQDLQTKYNFAQSQQPSPWSTVAAGVGKGLYSGLNSYFDQTDKQSLLSQQTGSQLMLQSSRDQAAEQAQQAILDRLLTAQRLKEEAAAAEQGRKSQAFSQFLQARTPQTMMLPGATTTRPDFSGGAEPPVMGPSPSAVDALQGGQGDFTTSPVEQPPETYAGSVTTPGAPSLRQMPGLDVIQSLASVDPNLVGYLMNPEILKELNAQDAKGQMKPAEVTARLNALREAVAAGALDPAQASRQLAADTGIQIDLTEPIAVQEAKLKMQYQRAGLTGGIPGVKPEQAAAVAGGFGSLIPDPTKSPLANALPGAETLIAIANAPDGSPVFDDPSARVLGRTPAEMRAAARQTLVGQGAMPNGSLDYRGQIAQAQGFGTGMGAERARQTVPMGTEAQNWINPQTLESAPQGTSEIQARAAGYVAVSAKQAAEVDALRGTIPMAAKMRSLFDPSVVGPGMGRFNTVLEWLNVAPQSFADLRAAVEKYRSEAARAAAGAAIGPAEREIYFSTYPDVHMSPQQFQTTLAMVETGLRIARNRVVGGGVAPSKPEVPTGQEITLGGRRVVVDGANADGSLNVHDPITREQNVWRP